MHPNPAFRKASTDENLAFARQRSFGTMCVNGAEGPVLAHVPFILAADGTSVDLHLARSNRVIAEGLPAKAVLAVVGPDAYVSPDWYGVADQVPTWNYITVHLRGELFPMPLDGLRAHLEALSDQFEARLAPKKPWKTAKMTEGVMERMMRMILPFRLVIASIDGTWKLGQNKTAEARAGVIAALGARVGAGWPAGVAQAMSALPED
ncbi:MAG: FMN-binding negative transcriptional regulator [bacterium]